MTGLETFPVKKEDRSLKRNDRSSFIGINVFSNFTESFSEEDSEKNYNKKLDSNEQNGKDNSEDYTMGISSGILISGEVSGTWTLDNSPYILTGDVELSGDLLIEPGVAVYSDGAYSIKVDHYNLIANGNEYNRIIFSAINPDTGWEGIRFYYSSNSSLSYCDISYIKNTAPDNYFSNPWGVTYYGAGSVFCAFSSVSFDHCKISNNNSIAGGGIYSINNSNLTIINSEFYNNVATEQGGAIAFINNSNLEDVHSTPMIKKTLFYNNTAGVYNGGAIYAENNVSLILVNNTISKNSATGGLEGIPGVSLYFSQGSWIRIFDSILWKPSNDPIVIYDSYSSWGTYVDVKHSCITEGVNGITVYQQGSVTGIYNFDERVFGDDPLYRDYENNDFSLSSLSPCIDAGGSYGTRSVDPDGTVPDMGAKPYYQPDHINKPENVSVSSDSLHRPVLSWDEAYGAIYYKIVGSEDAYGNFETLADSIRSYSWIDTVNSERKFYKIIGKNNRSSSLSR